MQPSLAPVIAAFVMLGASSARAQEPPSRPLGIPQSAPQVSTAVAAHLRDYMAAMKERHAIGVSPSTRDRWDAARAKERRSIEAALAAARTDDELLGVHGAALEGFHDDIALDAARNALRNGPRAWHYLGIAYAAWKQGEYLGEPRRSEMLKEANDAIARGLPLDGSAPAWVLKGGIHAVTGDAAQARAAFDAAEKIGVPQANRLDVVRGRWRIAVLEKNESEARRWFAELTRSGQATDHDEFSHGNFLLGLGRYADAAPIFEALAAEPEQYTWTETYNVLYRAAYARWMVGQQDAAMALAARTVREGAGKPEAARVVSQAHSITAHMLLSRGDAQRALDSARVAITSDPSYAWAHTQLARAANLLQMTADAEAAARKAIDLSDGKDSEAHFELGMAYFAQKRWGLAQQSFETVTRLDKTHAYAAYNIAQALVNAGTERDALPWYEEALRRDPNMKERDAILASIARIRGR